MFKHFSTAVERRLRDFDHIPTFKVDVIDIYSSYLSSFPEGTNPRFRERTEYDCSCCKHFIRNLGNVVAIDNGNILTIWDNFESLPYPFNVVSSSMAELIRQSPIVSVFRTDQNSFGQAQNRDNKNNEIVWNHFHGRVPTKSVSSCPDADCGKHNTNFEVIKSSLTKITSDSVSTVIDLILDNSIYRGQEHLSAVKEFQTLQNNWEKSGRSDLYIWENYDHWIGNFKSTVIGTLLSDLSEGRDLEAAVASFEVKVAPHNYKRSKSLITPKMIESAVDKLKELGIEHCIERRFATIEDVNVRDVLFVDRDARSKMKGGLVGLLLGSDRVKKTPISTDDVTPIKIEDFLRLSFESVDIVLNNKQLGNFVSITAPQYPDTGKLFKWNNDFAWSYDGEITDSIKERVKIAGGKVGDNVKLRVSLAWHNSDDLDLHVIDPWDQHFFFNNKDDILDVDMNVSPDRRDFDPVKPVENMSWTDRLFDGQYDFIVDMYTKRENERIGFILEVEEGNEIHQFICKEDVSKNHRNFNRTQSHLRLTVKNGKVTHIQHHPKLKLDNSPVEKWGVSTLTPLKVNTIMLSPNYWENAGSTGNKHWFFIIEECKNPEPVRGIYNEFLRGELEPHRKVFEVLGSKTKCPPADNQLSGVGFSSTRGDKVIAIADGRKYEVEF